MNWVTLLLMFLYYQSQLNSPPNNDSWLVVSTPLKNMSSSVGMIIPNIWKVIKIHVPNHEPDSQYYSIKSPFLMALFFITVLALIRALTIGDVRCLKVEKWHVGRPSICDICDIFCGLPSGKHTKNYGTSPFLMGKQTISMAIFNSYVCLSEGKSYVIPWICLRNTNSKNIFPTKIPQAVDFAIGTAHRTSQSDNVHIPFISASLSKSFTSQLPSGNLTLLLKMAIFSGKINYFYGHFQ